MMRTSLSNSRYMKNDQTFHPDTTVRGDAMSHQPMMEQSMSAPQAEEPAVSQFPEMQSMAQGAVAQQHQTVVCHNVPFLAESTEVGTAPCAEYVDAEVAVVARLCLVRVCGEMERSALVRPSGILLLLLVAANLLYVVLVHIFILLFCQCIRCGSLQSR